MKIKVSKRKEAVIKAALQNLRDDIIDEDPDDIYFDGMSFGEVVSYIAFLLDEDLD